MKGSTFVLVLLVLVISLICLIGLKTLTDASAAPQPTTYQGKSVTWWAKHAVQARKDANARGQTIKRLKTVMRHDESINECVKLATIVYPRFTEARAWRIIFRESWTTGKQHAKNAHSTASGLMQFLTSTWATTPFAGISIWSTCGATLGAGWMHQNGRGGEWNYN